MAEATDHPRSLFASLRRWLPAGAVIVALGCATPPPAPAPPPPVKPPEPVVAAPEPTPPPAPVTPAAPVVPPAQARPMAQRLALDSVELLQTGEEARAVETLDRALALDPTNELARKLMDQVKGDAQRELGAVFFRYTVQRDDTLAKIAQQYMGDRFRFYILAKYNEIANPSRLAAGQVIKIPGRAPLTPPAAPPTARVPAPPEQVDASLKPPPAPVPPPVDVESPQKREVAALVQRGVDAQKGGNLEGAYAAFSEAEKRDPTNKDASAQKESIKQALVRRYDREASQAFQRQNLDDAIAKWTRVLELDPNNQKARLERDRANNLKKRMNEKFGAK